MGEHGAGQLGRGAGHRRQPGQGGGAQDTVPVAALRVQLLRGEWILGKIGCMVNKEINRKVLVLPRLALLVHFIFADF